MAAALWVLPMQAERLTERDIRPERELLITAPSVVDSEATKYPGSWSFGSLVERLAGAEKASEFVRDWLSTWTVGQTINEQLVAPRPGIVEKVIRPWQERDGYNADSGEPWKPKLVNAPFRLLAIVNRMDLSAPRVADVLNEVRELWRLRGREKEFDRLRPQATAGGFGYNFLGNNGSTSSGSAGEGRLVFGAVDSNGIPLKGEWTVIFEYHLPVHAGRSLHQWAQAWHGLGGVDVSDVKFAEQLEQITRLFTHGEEGVQPGVQLAQLRSSEAAFGPHREFRQFSAQFKPTPLTMTPAQTYARRHSPEHRSLLAFLHDQEGLIRSGVHHVPLTISVSGESRSLLAGSAFIPADDPDFHWDRGPLVSRDARRIFSLNTCNGCHAGETGCREGLHIRPRATGSAAQLSEFLRTDGKTHRLNDPDVRGEKVEYQEMKDRAAILAALLEPKDRARIEALRPVLRERLERTH
jgi:hypothetical protein